MNKKDHNRLVEIRTEMINLLNEASDLIRDCGNIYERAKYSWLGGMQNALAKHRSVLLPETMYDTINLLDCQDLEDLDLGEYGVWELVGR